ncbi:mechanosensitive ion channel family protein [Xylanibacillus composti]|nr:mechanosensitive ion channel family protein [Xylanibacillus composti]
MDEMSNPDNWLNWGMVLVKIVVILAAAGIAKRIVRRAITHMIADRQNRRIQYDPRRAKTMGKLIGNVSGYTINFIALLLIIDQFGYSLMPLLAGAGVLGLAIGFGAQNLVRDVITGFFIIFEDQFGVGDVIMVNGQKGTVEEIGLRVTKLRIWTGEIHIIPNGAIGEVTNFSVNNSIGVTDISIAYESDIDKALQVIKETAMKVKEMNENVVGDPDVLGVQSLGASEVIIRVLTECKPNTQFAVGRQMNAELKKALDQAGIEIPYPRLVTLQRKDEPAHSG